ncbi:MAG: DUF58 domain-containing protein [Planctomycetes bacterium]|nr:DUF58 domain-containing protein [Planctomycetota bacterium]
MLHTTGSSLIQPTELARLHSLEVAARLVVEGLQTGAHRSPHKGHSVDFADHRPYVPGDDLRHLDWKVLGRSDRLVLKRYEAETDLGCTLVVDGSASMGYKGDRSPVSKYRYASALAASMAYLVLQQQDRAGLVIFGEKAVIEHKPSRTGQLERICRALEQHQPTAGTDAVKSLEHLVQPAYHKGLVIVFSDFLADPAIITDTLDRLRHRGHDVALVWLLDPDEADLGVSTVSRFEGMEEDGTLTAEPRSLRAAYAAEVAKHRLALQKLCRARKFAFVEAVTSEPPSLPLNRLLVDLHAERR